MNFIPSQPKGEVTVPYFEDANREEGWQGYSTTKGIERLKSEITESITRLGGFVSGFQQGRFLTEKSRERDGFQIHYSIESANGMMMPGRLDIAALPVKDKWNGLRKDKSLRMALYMLRVALDGMWFMQQLSPGYAPLMPWMVGKDGRTISQMWADSPVMSRLLPPGESEFQEDVVEGEAA